MTLRYSIGARNLMAGLASFKDIFQNGKLEIYTGAQPATCETAASGTLLCTITAASAARTAEVRASGTVTLNTGSSGSVDAITVNSIEILGAAVPYNTSLTQTAADVATQINSFRSSTEYEASSSGAVITIKALPGTGTVPNGFVVASTVTTLTKTDVNLSGGVAAVNGLRWGPASAGTIAKLASQSWTGVNGASGTAGWYRFYGSEADAGGTDSTNTAIREDGSVASSGADLNMNTSFTAAATTTISTWSRTLPTS